MSDAKLIGAQAELIRGLERENALHLKRVEAWRAAISSLVDGIDLARALVEAGRAEEAKKQLEAVSSVALRLVERHAVS